MFGEILFDEFPDRRVLGGAPFNVTRHLRGFQLDPTIVSRIGTDESADVVLEAMRKAQLDESGVQRDDERPTGRVSIHMSGTSHRFEIVPNQAYDYIEAEGARRTVVEKEPKLFYFGTLAQRNDASRGALAAAVEAATCPKLLDVNLRKPWYDRETIHRSFGDADLVKLNDDELDEIAPALDCAAKSDRDRVARLIERYALRAIVVTCGEEGAWLLAGDGEEHRASGAGRLDNLVDTVGAGDGFASVLILGTLRGWHPAKTLERADEFARAICGIRGAIPDDDKFYQPFMKDWGITKQLSRIEYP